MVDRREPWMGKALSAVTLAALFIALSIPVAYRATAALYPAAVSPSGPTPLGVVIHALLFMAIYWAASYVWDQATMKDEGIE